MHNIIFKKYLKTVKYINFVNPQIPGLSAGLENFRDPGIRESRDPGIAIPNCGVNRPNNVSASPMQTQ